MKTKCHFFFFFFFQKDAQVKDNNDAFSSWKKLERDLFKRTNFIFRKILFELFFHIHLKKTFFFQKIQFYFFSPKKIFFSMKLINE